MSRTDLDYSRPARPRKKGTPRDPLTYRGARRNRVIRFEGRVWKGVIPTHKWQWKFDGRIFAPPGKKPRWQPAPRYTPERLREIRRSRKWR